MRESSSSVRIGDYANLCLREEAERAEAHESVNTETQIALANFVSAASSYRNTISSLTNTIADLSKELAKANIAISALTKKFGNGISTPSGNGGGGNNKKRKYKNIATNIHGKEREFDHKDNDFYDPMAYCWSHGFRCRIEHDSSTCLYKNKDTSTLLHAPIHIKEVKLIKIGSDSLTATQSTLTIIKKN